jgi:uncharacterized integral membrane protein
MIHPRKSAIMKIRTLLLLLVLSLVAGFAALNRAAFLAPTTLSLGLADVQAPLGLVMLGLLVFVTGLFLVQTTVLFDARQHAKELQSNRKLADQAEASRFTELRSFLELELRKQLDQDGHSRAAVLTRIDQMEATLRLVVEQSGNSLAAALGELEDRLDKGNKDVTHNLLA